MVKKVFYVLLSVLMLYSVGSCKSGGRSSGGGLDVDEDQFSGISIAADQVQGFIENMSNPVEMAKLIEDIGAGYSNNYLATTDKLDDFVTNNQQAFNLGIYSADLGYLNMYNRTKEVLDYIGAIKILSDYIKVSQFFDYQTLTDLAKNSNNLDSLMLISVQSFNRMDRYLRDNKRANLSILIITGVWMEGMYLATQVYKTNPHPNLKERIGEQQIVLDKLLDFLKNFESDDYFKNLIAELKILQEDLEQVKITIKPGEMQTIEKPDGTVEFVQNETSVIELSNELVTTIINNTETIRNKLISL